MQGVAQKVEAKYKKAGVVDVKSGDTVRVHQKVKEGNKTRVQVFEGLVIRTSKKNSLTSTFTVRRIASGVGVEKSFLIHSPNVVKVEVVKRSKVRRNYLSYMRELTGKSARLSGVDFDKRAVNAEGEVAKEPKVEKPAEGVEQQTEEAPKKVDEPKGEEENHPELAKDKPTENAEEKPAEKSKEDPKE